MLRYLTAGESHGKALVAILEGMPAGLRLDTKLIDKELKRRQQGYGRGKRMEIESDKVEILSGIKKGITIGSPIAVLIKNKDFKIDKLPSVRCPRPGHADLAGMIKYNTVNARDILERSSARETAARVAIGAICRIFLREFKIDIFSYTKYIGDIEVDAEELTLEAIKRKAAISCLNCPDKKSENLMKQSIDQSKKRGDTLGGGFEVIGLNIMPGLGSHVHYDRKIDARLALELMSIQAIKGVEFGAGFLGTQLPGSEFHDEILLKGKALMRRTNNAGGVEGGMTNGEPLRVSCAMKPIATLMNPLSSVDMKTGKSKKASTERSDVCALPAASVVAENVTAFVLVQAILEKFGGDSMNEIEKRI
ncbi:MAG: chorismate synthase [Candidatus Orphnella occulta]|nr:chorismate synthase [Candidatus Orphnella occulta]MDP8296611.1 chorismate synthase [Candidatus Orphnella occulta]